MSEPQNDDEFLSSTSEQFANTNVKHLSISVGEPSTGNAGLRARGASQEPEVVSYFHSSSFYG